MIEREYHVRISTEPFPKTYIIDYYYNFRCVRAISFLNYNLNCSFFSFSLFFSIDFTLYSQLISYFFVFIKFAFLICISFFFLFSFFMPVMTPEEAQRTQKPYRYGMILLCFGALINWIGLAENYTDPFRYAGVACIIGGAFLICTAMCCWLHVPNRSAVGVSEVIIIYCVHFTVIHYLTHIHTPLKHTISTYYTDGAWTMKKPKQKKLKPFHMIANISLPCKYNNNKTS